MATELNIFDVATATPTDSWAYGSAAAKAWFTGLYIACYDANRASTTEKQKFTLYSIGSISCATRIGVRRRSP